MLRVTWATLILLRYLPGYIHPMELEDLCGVRFQTLALVLVRHIILTAELSLSLESYSSCPELQCDRASEEHEDTCGRVLWDVWRKCRRHGAPGTESLTGTSSSHPKFLRKMMARLDFLFITECS